MWLFNPKFCCKFESLEYDIYKVSPLISIYEFIEWNYDIYEKFDWICDLCKPGSECDTANLQCLFEVLAVRFFRHAQTAHDMFFRTYRHIYSIEFESNHDYIIADVIASLKRFEYSLSV